MQAGSIKAHGKWWVLKYYADVLKDGVKFRKSLYKKLARLDREHQPKADGSAPEKVQALAALELAPLNAGLRQPHSLDSFKSFLETFLAKGVGGKGRELNPTTRQSYRMMYALAKPFVPDIELRLVRTPTIHKLLHDVAAADGADRRAQSAYNNLKNFLSSACRYAVQHDLLEYNPVRDAAVPQGNTADTHACTLKEVHAILQALTNPVSRALVTVAFFTGLRSEELKGLRWEDYNGKVLQIRRGVVYGKVVGPKTDSSKAPVAVVGIVRKTLERLPRGDGGYIFPVQIDHMGQRQITTELTTAGIEWHGWHAFRRGLATHLESLAVGREKIKLILRHSTTDVASKHYIKSNPEENRKALELVERDFLALKPKVKL